MENTTEKPCGDCYGATSDIIKYSITEIYYVFYDNLSYN